MIAKKKLALLCLSVLMAVAFAIGCMSLIGWKGVSAYDGLPSEFGNTVGEALQDADGNSYVNYERGYVKYAAGTETDDPTKASAHVGGKNVEKDGDGVKEILVDAETMTGVKDWDTLLSESTAGARIAYGVGWSADAAKQVGEAFRDKWTALIDDRYNVGVPCSNIDVLSTAGDGDALAFAMHFRYGDSTYNADGGQGGTVNECYLVYNSNMHEVFLMTDGFVGGIGEIRKLGAPVTEQVSGVTVGGWNSQGTALPAQNVTVQVFEKGIMIATAEESGKVTEASVNIGVPEKTDENAYSLHPLINDQDVVASGKGESIKIEKDGKEIKLGFVGDIDGTWHALRSARVASHEGGKITVEFNFRAGCIEVVYNESDYSLVSRMAYAGQNYVYKDGESARETLPFETFTTDDHLYQDVNAPVESAALDMFRSLSGNAQATNDDVKKAFKEGYYTLLEEGIVPGYRCSNIKVWTVLCLDFKYSPDSENGFDAVGSAGRERMYTLVYSGKQNAVYGVGGGIWQVWKEDSIRPSLGAPISNVLTDKTIDGEHFTTIQIFEKGYIYENASGSFVAETGVTTNGDYTHFVYEPAPAQPSQYGNQTKQLEGEENGRFVMYINYEHGAVRAVQSNTGKGYVYQYLPGRNFVAEGDGYTAQMLPYEKLYSDSDFKCDSAYNGIFNDFEEDGVQVKGAKNQIIDMIKALLEEDFFPGFPETQGFCAWNNSGSLQFIYGDSTALPFGGDARTNVCAMVWNDKLNKIFLIKDAFMDLWGGSAGAYTSLGVPYGDEFTLEGNPNVIFQMYQDTVSLDGKAFAVSVGYNEATYFTSASGMTPERYNEMFEELSRPLTGVSIVPPEQTQFAVGGYVVLEYVIDGASADATITVTSSDENVAKVQADGTVEFLADGTATITVSVSDGVNTFTDSVTFTVGSGSSGGCSSAAAGIAPVFAAAAVAAAVTVCVVRRRKVQ